MFLIGNVLKRSHQNKLQEKKVKTFLPFLPFPLTVKISNIMQLRVCILILLNSLYTLKVSSLLLSYIQRLPVFLLYIPGISSQMYVCLHILQEVHRYMLLLIAYINPRGISQGKAIIVLFVALASLSRDASTTTEFPQQQSVSSVVCHIIDCPLVLSSSNTLEQTHWGKQSSSLINPVC